MFFLVPKQKKICSHSLHKNGRQLPEQKNRVVPVHQHGRHDVTIYLKYIYFFISTAYCLTTKEINKIFILTKNDNIRTRSRVASAININAVRYSYGVFVFLIVIDVQ